MTPEERANALAELAADLFWQDYCGNPTGRGAKAILQGNIADAIRAAVDAERERCARVCAGLAESYQVRGDTDSASALSAAAGLLRARPGLDCCELTGPAKDIGLPRHEMPDRDGLWTYRHTDGSLYYCTASAGGDVLTWSRTPPQGDWAGVWECMEDDESGTTAGGEQ